MTENTNGTTPIERQRMGVDQTDAVRGSRVHLDAINRGARWCYYVSEAQRDAQGHIPSLVVENVPGHVPMTGNGEHAAPWHWGLSFEIAQRTCRRVNERRGITLAIADEIVAASMRASELQRRRGSRS